MSKRLAALSILGLLFASVASAQQIYKWKDEKGQWHFQQGSSRGPVPVVRVTMEKLTYNHGYIRIEGTAENISNAPLPAPRITMTGLDFLDDTIYGQSTAWPGGSYSSKIASGQSAVFSTLFSIPDKAKGKEVKVEVSVDGYPFDLTWKVDSRIRVW